MIKGLMLVLVGVGLIVAMVLLLRAARVRDGLYRHKSRLRSVLRLRPTPPQTFVRRFEVGIYAGMCLGATIAIVGALVAAG